MTQLRDVRHGRHDSVPIGVVSRTAGKEHILELLENRALTEASQYCFIAGLVAGVAIAAVAFTVRIAHRAPFHSDPADGSPRPVSE